MKICSHIMRKSELFIYNNLLIDFFWRKDVCRCWSSGCLFPPPKISTDCWVQPWIFLLFWCISQDLTPSISTESGTPSWRIPKRAWVELRMIYYPSFFPIILQASPEPNFRIPFQLDFWTSNQKKEYWQIVTYYQSTYWRKFPISHEKSVIWQAEPPN